MVKYKKKLQINTGRQIKKVNLYTNKIQEKPNLKHAALQHLSSFRSMWEGSFVITILPTLIIIINR